MGKVNELLQLIEELNRCGNTLIDISEELKNLFSGSEEDSRKTEAKTKTAEKASKEEKTISLEDVRAVMADKSRKGYLTVSLKESVCQSILEDIIRRSS